MLQEKHKKRQLTDGEMFAVHGAAQADTVVSEHLR